MTGGVGHSGVAAATPGGTAATHTANGTAPPRSPIRTPVGLLPTRERRPGYIALLVALIVGVAAVGAVLYSKAGAKTPVVVVVREVAQGHPLQRADLSTVTVSGDVTAIAGSGLSGVIGKTVTVELLPNTLLQRSMLTTAGPLASGQALVGVALGSGQLPADGLAAGDTVRVIQLPPKNAAVTGPVAGGTAPQAVVLVATAQVFSAHADPSNAGGTVVSLVVSTQESTEVAAASAAGLVALVQVPSS
jgi:hypothetical protein